MKSRVKKKIVIIGGGPAGCTLATLLSRKGHSVFLFNQSKNADLFVGESLIPAIIPILKELKIEDEVKSFSKFKPGATVWVKSDIPAEASFANGMNTLPPYAYNTNRKKFNRLLIETAKEAGVTIIEAKAGLYADGDRICLDEATLQEMKGNLQPDFLIDASGRKRTFSNLLNLPTTTGERSDTALFAHVKERNLKPNSGDIHMHLATKGWCWQIPLKGETSVGIVVQKNYLKTFGESVEEQFDNYLKSDKKLAPHFQNVKRISAIQKYSNYQLQSNRVYGENWALMGDSAGFLDPVFSSGLYFSMKYASVLAQVLDEENLQKGLKTYQKDWNTELDAWRQMIEVWYNGRLFTNFLVGNERVNSVLGRVIEKHAVKHFTAIFTGEAVLNTYSMWLLRFMTGSLLDFMSFFKMHPYKVKDLEI